MKKTIAILFVLAILTGLAACGAESEKESTAPAETQESVSESAEAASGEISRLIINSEPVVVTAKECFDNAGVKAFICDADGKYQFNCDDEGVEWSVYALDSEFEDGARYLSQSEIPVLIGDGVVELTEGQYIYVECSENAFTADAPSEAKVEINYASELSGNYADSYSQRAVAQVIDKGDEAEVTVFWSSSAFERSVWKMTCAKDGDKLSYSDCKKSNVTSDDSGITDEETVYENGSGYFTVKDGKLYWDGASEEDCRPCIFE